MARTGPILARLATGVNEPKRGQDWGVKYVHVNTA